MYRLLQVSDKQTKAENKKIFALLVVLLQVCDVFILF